MHSATSQAQRQRAIFSMLLMLAGLCAGQVLAQSQELVHHSLKVVLDPQQQFIRVEDTINLPEGIDSSNAEFSLNSNLVITGNSGVVQSLGSGGGNRTINGNSAGDLTVDLNRYSATIPGGGRQIVVSYQGQIYQQAIQTSAEYAQSFAETTGIISDEGVYLNGASAWIPDFATDLLTFDLSVSFVGLARSWTAISQGSRTGSNGWQESAPMEEVYLVAAQFTEYSVAANNVELLAYLRTPDANLANKYLDAAERYLAFYEPLLGDYPFSKFALVENFWETGYGMPSFTLLGRQVIRLPFIIDSSYPHEILHNWWGNGVYPDYATGNWSEGLTAYLADHLFQEMNAQGPEYRKDSLIRYRNYVAAGGDFPLRNFTARNSAASQAVGYGKSLMLWHMLRQEVGDDQFLAGLRQLYQDRKFQRVSFMDIADLYSELSGRDLRPFFEQWVNRTGAPAFQMSVENANGNRARIMFAQIQEDAPFTVNMPVALYYADETQPQIYNIPLSQKFEGVVAENFSNLQAVVVDPYFDVFRQLSRAEIPPSIGQLFGAEDILFVLPQAEREAWRSLAESFAAGVNAQIVGDDEITSLPADRSVWILGQGNAFAASVREGVANYPVSFDPAGITLQGDSLPFADRSTVLVARHPGNPELAIGWIHVGNPAAMSGMIEKLPHYGKYSYLSFTGAEPVNDVKGVWTSADSPMQWFADNLPAGYQPSTLPEVPNLAKLPPKYLPEQLQRHVSRLTAPDLVGRKAGSPGARLAADYIAEQFRALGLRTLGGTYSQQWSEPLPRGTRMDLRNVVAVLPGSDRSLSARPVVLGAHYDHLGQVAGEVYPGADDNASGVSILLEVAAKLSRSYVPKRSILFVAFDGEESALVGSRHFVESPPAPYRGEDFFAMINLDSVGRLEGRALQIFAADSAYEWPFMAQGIGFTTGLASELADAVIASSDHVSFLNAGVPAIHLFAGVTPDYHQASDTPDKLDYAGMGEIAQWVEEALVFLGDREVPLRVTLDSASVPVNTEPASAREAGLGSVPDFAFAGPGVRLSAVTPGGPAALAGLRAGDILLRYNGVTLGDLQAYSDRIRESAVGDTVALDVLRDQQTLQFQVTLQAR